MILWPRRDSLFHFSVHFLSCFSTTLYSHFNLLVVYQHIIHDGAHCIHRLKMWGTVLHGTSVCIGNELCTETQSDGCFIMVCQKILDNKRKPCRDIFIYCAPTNSQPEQCLDASLIALLNHRDVFFNFYITVPDCYCQFVLKKLYAADMCKLRTGLRLHLIQDSCGEQ